MARVQGDGRMDARKAVIGGFTVSTRLAVNIPEGEVEYPTSIPARSADGRETSGNMPERGGGVPDLRSGPVKPWRLAVPVAWVGG